jgi:hypothetical protein
MIKVITKDKKNTNEMTPYKRRQRVKRMKYSITGSFREHKHTQKSLALQSVSGLIIQTY